MVIIVKTGGWMDKFLHCVATVANLVLPGHIHSRLECSLCKREVEAGDEARHLAYFHPDIDL